MQPSGHEVLDFGRIERNMEFHSHYIFLFVVFARLIREAFLHNALASKAADIAGISLHFNDHLPKFIFGLR